MRKSILTFEEQECLMLILQIQFEIDWIGLYVMKNIYVKV